MTALPENLAIDFSIDHINAQGHLYLKHMVHGERQVIKIELIQNGTDYSRIVEAGRKKMSTFSNTTIMLILYPIAICRQLHQSSITPKLRATMNALIILRANSLILDGNLVDKKLDTKL
mgnify:CR=1 FL=1